MKNRVENENEKTIVAIDKNGDLVHCGDEVLFGEHRGIVQYNIPECRFMIKWYYDNQVRPISEDFALQLEVAPKEEKIEK